MGSITAALLVDPLSSAHACDERSPARPDFGHSGLAVSVGSGGHVQIAAECRRADIRLPVSVLVFANSDKQIEFGVPFGDLPLAGFVQLGKFKVDGGDRGFSCLLTGLASRIKRKEERWKFCGESVASRELLPLSVHLAGVKRNTAMLKPVGLISGHYECRRLDDTIPVFTDLLAMEVLERKAGTATLKHPNTEWRLIVHEGGPEAPDKGFDNHYGFRVGSHQEVETAWQYLEATKEKYRLSKITKPQQAHYAYSVYFNEPGGNTLEIEYYNPGGALHGRSHTAEHWETALSTQRFRARGYVPQAFSHGTLQCDDSPASQRFYTEVLGLEFAGRMNMAVYIKHPATPWYIVTLPRAARKYLAPVNRFTLQLESATVVEQAHGEFGRHGNSFGVAEVYPREKSGDRLSFIFSDLDRNWWELAA